MMMLHRSVRGRGGVALAAVASCCLSVACTKVLEQPQAVQAPPPSALQEPAPAPKNQPLPAGKSWGLLDRGGSPSARAGRLRDSLNDDPDGLNRSQLNAAIQAVLPGLGPCFVGTPENNAMVTFEADPNGSPRAVTVSGVNAAAQTCIRGLISSVQYPRFKGNPVPISYPLSVHRTETPAPAPPQPAPAGPSAAPSAAAPSAAAAAQPAAAPEAAPSPFVNP